MGPYGTNPIADSEFDSGIAGISHLPKSMLPSPSPSNKLPVFLGSSRLKGQKKTERQNYGQIGRY